MRTTNYRSANLAAVPAGNGPRQPGITGAKGLLPESAPPVKILWTELLKLVEFIFKYSNGKGIKFFWNRGRMA